MKTLATNTKEKDLNKLVAKFSVNDIKYEIDELLDFRDYPSPGMRVFHLFRMTGSSSKTGDSVGGDFTSKQEAKEEAMRDYEENFA